MYLINGKISPQFSIRDRGLAYGDGLFETMAIINGQLHNWPLHYNRLVDGANRLGIIPPLEEELLEGINLFLEHKHSERFVIKMILTRGEGGKGYQCPQLQSNNWIMMDNSWPEYPDKYYLEGINVKQLEFKLSVQPVLAGIKHLNRLEQVIAKQNLPEGYQEALLNNTNNCIIEGISSNIFFSLGDVLCIPSLKISGIAGTIRAQIIEICQQQNIKYQIADFDLKQLILSDEIFYSNSIIGLWPVKNLSLLDGRELSYKPGTFYKKISVIINAQLDYPVYERD